VALIPSIEFFQRPDYVIVSDACIACRGPVRSVKLLSRVPLEAIRTLALDEGSRTSVALVRILLKERLGIEPRLAPLPIDAPYQNAATDAVLVIGDRAIHPARGEWVVQWDLGEEWNRWSELPFVFAMWVTRGAGDSPAGKGSAFRVQGSGRRAPKRSAMDDLPDAKHVEFAELAAVLARARDLGVGNVERIARAEHDHYGLTYDECLTYFRDHLHFTLGPREVAGLRLFYEQACGLGLAPRGRASALPQAAIGRAPRSPLPLGEG
jgi:chorismate dehydratase